MRIMRIMRIMRVAVCGALALTRPAHGGGPLDSVAPGDAPNPVASDPWLAHLGSSALFALDARDLADRWGYAEPPGSRRGLWLGVSGGLSSSPGERQRIFGLVELGIGLDVWVGDRAPEQFASSDDPGGDESGATRAADASPGRSRAPVVASSSAPPSTASAAFSPPSPPSSSASSALPDSGRAGRHAPLQSALTASGSAAPARLSVGALGVARVPSGDARSTDPGALAALARAAVAAAARIGGVGAELRRLDGMASRSRAAASLPEVRLGAGTSRDESLRLQPTLTDPGRFTRDGGRDLWLEARLTWRLDSAIFARDEIAIMRLRAQQREEGARLAADVLESLVDWQRARLLLASEKAPPEERDAAMIRQFGAVARLDLLTDGWFSRQLERGRRPAESPAWP